MDPIVTSMAPGDWEAVRRIYKEAIATGHASFDTEVPEWYVKHARSTHGGAGSA